MIEQELQYGHLAAMQGVFVVHRKFTERNRAGIVFLRIICYNKLSYLY